MKLKLATDFEIYRMRDLITILNFTPYFTKAIRLMQRQLDKEFNKRKIIVPLAWDLYPENVEKRER